MIIEKFYAVISGCMAKMVFATSWKLPPPPTTMLLSMMYLLDMKYFGFWILKSSNYPYVKNLLFEVASSGGDNFCDDVNLGCKQWIEWW